jgi:integrase
MKPSPVPQPTLTPRRRRFQRGSLQKRPSADGGYWMAFWWDHGHRKSQNLGPGSGMSRAEALTAMAELLQPVNAHAGEPASRLWTLGAWIRDVFLPLRRGQWKASTASTTGDRIRKHVIGDLGAWELPSITRQVLQNYLEQKAKEGLSFSVLEHLRWDLRAICRLASQDGLLPSNPAEHLVVPRAVPTRVRRLLAPGQIHEILQVLDLREQLIVRLALLSGMRPSEILALQWKHVHADHVEVVQRLYRGTLDRPKSERSTRQVALSTSTQAAIDAWRLNQAPTDPQQWVFPSARPDRPLGRDNTWRRWLEPRLKTVHLEWATFQVMRRTHATLARQVGIDPKLVADQLGHGVGVHLDVYTIAALDQRQHAVDTLEAALAQL